ncbi:hypothetical protein HYV49_01285 [Candidatus Pacearchaeota archaeon]|nr:hypothetical protein [Candidatus Pacearchaeota archaeon]
MTGNRIKQEQVYEIIVGKEISWQAILFDLINTEQLDPWDIDVALLAQKYLERVRQYEEENFLVSSKVLFACSLLLRIKSEILLHKHMKSIDEILFGKEEELKQEQKFEFNEEIPLLYPRTPLPRYKKVSLKDLMTALTKAIETENRRIRREIVFRRAIKDSELVLPRRKFNLGDEIKRIYSKIHELFSRKNKPVAYTELAGNGREERIAHFMPVLHLDTQNKIDLQQKEHFDEIMIHPNGKLKIDSEWNEFANPIADFFELMMSKE